MLLSVFVKYSCIFGWEWGVKVFDATSGFVISTCIKVAKTVGILKVSGCWSHWNLLYGSEVKVLGHLLDERGGLAFGEVEDVESMDVIAERRGEADPFVFEVLLNL